MVVSSIQLVNRVMFYQMGAEPPPQPTGRPLRIAVIRSLIPLISLPESLSGAELIPVNDLTQSIHLLMGGRVEYLTANTVSMTFVQQVRDGTVRQAADLPAAMRMDIALACHDSPQARALISALNTSHPQGAQAQQHN